MNYTCYVLHFIFIICHVVYVIHIHSSLLHAQYNKIVNGITLLICQNTHLATMKNTHFVGGLFRRVLTLKQYKQ